MKKETNTIMLGRDAYVKPRCKSRAIAQSLCNASVPDVEPGGDMDQAPSYSTSDEGKEGLWN